MAVFVAAAVPLAPPVRLDACVPSPAVDETGLPRTGLAAWAALDSDLGGLAAVACFAGLSAGAGSGAFGLVVGLVVFAFFAGWATLGVAAAIGLDRLPALL